jgi:phage-related protein
LFTETIPRAVENAVQAFLRFPIVGTLVQTAFDGLRIYVETVWGTIRVIIETAIGVIQGIIKTVLALIRGDWEGAWEGIKQIGKSVWDGIVGLIEVGVRAVEKTFGLLLRFAARFGPELWDAIVGIFTTIKDATVGAAEQLVSLAAEAIGALPGKIMDLGGKFLEAGGWIIDKLKEGITTAAKAVGGFASDIASAVSDAVKGAVNWIIDRVNRALEFTIKVPFGPDIHVNPPDIPHVAGGGVIGRTTLALVGERGPELVMLPGGAVVLPAHLTRRLLEREPAPAPQVTVQLLGPVQASTLADAERAGRGIGYALAASLRARGVL